MHACGQAALTLQFGVLPCQEEDHGLQLAELAVVGVNVCDAVDPGTRRVGVTTRKAPSPLPTFHARLTSRWLESGLDGASRVSLKAEH